MTPPLMKPRLCRSNSRRLSEISALLEVEVASQPSAAAARRCCWEEVLERLEVGEGGSRHETVLAAALGLVEGLVGALDERALRAGVFGERGKAERDRHGECVI